MKIKKSQLRRIIKEVSNETAELNAKLKIQGALDSTLSQEIKHVFRDYAMGERLGRNSGIALKTMSSGEQLMSLDPDRRVELFREVASELTQSSRFWASIEMVLGELEFKRLIKKMSVQFEAELRG